MTTCFHILPNANYTYSILHYIWIPVSLVAEPSAATHLVSPHAVTVEKSDLLILLSPHVVDTLVSLNIPDLQAGMKRKLLHFSSLRQAVC